MDNARIERVERVESGDARVRGFAVDLPPVEAVKGNGLCVAGWALGAGTEIPAIWVFSEGSLVRTWPTTGVREDVAKVYGPGTEKCGFHGTVLLSELPPRFDLEIKAEIDRGLVPLAVIHGQYARPQPLASADYLQPLVVTSLGRSGTTLLMRMLAAHPAIVAERIYPYETNAAAYWIHLIRVLTSPDMNAVMPGINVPPRQFDRGDWIEPPFVPVPEAYSPQLKEFMRGAYGPLAARFCLEAIESFYRQVAAAQKQERPRIYCEKMLPNGLHALFANCYPGMREILLVRDFRDVACSIFAFNAKRGRLSFGREHVESDEAYIPKLAGAALRLVENYRARKDRLLLVRYEDLVLKPVPTLREILAYLNLEASDAIIEGLMRPDDSAEFQAHRTTDSVTDSVGRWRRDLSPEMQLAVRRTFDGLLREFGYDTSVDGELPALEVPGVADAPGAKAGPWTRLRQIMGAGK